MSVVLSPVGNDAPFMDATGAPLSGGKLYTYVAGSSTPATTYKTSAGNTSNANPVVLDANGYPSASSAVVEIWLTAGTSYKFELQDSSGVTVWTRDNITGINDVASGAVDQWIAGGTPTYVSGTSFTLSGDQSSVFHAGRRLKSTNSSGSIYSYVKSVSYSGGTGLTTVVVVNDSGSLDSGLSSVWYGLLSASNPSTPLLSDAYPVVSGSSDATKKVRIEADGLTTDTTRVITVPDQDVTLGLPRSYLSGYTLSNNSGDATNDIDIAAGACRDSTNAANIILAAAITGKQLDAVWAVGSSAGMRASGAAIANTTYHIFAIRRPDTGVVDIAADTSVTGANIAANTNAAYTQIRRIGSILRESAAIVAFTQDGDEFIRSASGGVVSTTNPGTSAVLYTLLVPVGLKVRAIFNVNTSFGATGSMTLVSSPDEGDVAPSGSADSLANVGTGSSLTHPLRMEVRTDTSARVRARVDGSDGSVIVRFATIGWVDRRGRDA